MRVRFNYNSLSDLTCLSTFRNTLAENLKSLPTNALHSSGLLDCDPIHHVVALWIYAESLRPFVARRSIVAGSEYSRVQLLARFELVASLPKDREI